MKPHPLKHTNSAIKAHLLPNLYFWGISFLSAKKRAFFWKLAKLFLTLRHNLVILEKETIWKR